MKRLILILAALLLSTAAHAATVLHPSGGDDTANIQTALNTAPAGSEIHLAAGIYRASQLAVRQGVSITCDPATNLNGPADRAAFVVSADHVSIDSLAITAKDGVDFGPSTRDHESITNCTLNVTGCGINAVSLANTNIAADRFNLGPNALGIYIWVGAPPPGAGAAWNAQCPASWTNVTIDSCQFIGSPTYVGQCEGVHVRGDTAAPPGADNGPGKSIGLKFTRNRMRGISRCGFEYQAGGTGTIVEDNVFEQPALSTNRSVNDGSMAYSCAADASVGMVIRRNIARGEGRVADGVGVRNGFEVAGHGVQCTGNSVSDLNQAVILQTSTDGVVAGNQIVNCTQGAVPAGPQAVNGSITNNGPDVTLAWDVNRAWPASSGAVIVRSAPSVWTVATGRAVLNGTADLATYGVASVFEFPTGAGKWYQVNSGGDVWTLPGSTAVKVADPRPVVTTQPATQPAIVLDPIVSVLVTHASGKTEVSKP